MRASPGMTIGILRSRGSSVQAIIEIGDPAIRLGPVDLREVGTVLEGALAQMDVSVAPDLRFVDDHPSSCVSMDNTVLRLVMDLAPQPEGTPYVNLRRVDQTVDYGPINVQDLPFLIEALLVEGSQATQAVGGPPVQLAP